MEDKLSELEELAR